MMMDYSFVSALPSAFGYRNGHWQLLHTSGCEGESPPLPGTALCSIPG